MRQSPPTQHTAPAAADTTMVRVIVVDDHAAVREGIRAMLQSEPDLDPVATTATARDAVTLAQRVRPDVIVLDYHLPDEDGLSLCLRLKSAAPAPAVQSWLTTRRWAMLERLTGGSPRRTSPRRHPPRQ